MASILVVDDDELVARTIQNHLEASAHLVVVAHNGGKGLAELKARPFDLVISDILMPQVDGIEFIREIRRRGYEIPILAITGGGAHQSQNINLDYLALSKKFGATAILRKPFTRSDLMAKVDGCLAAGLSDPR